MSDHAAAATLARTMNAPTARPERASAPPPSRRVAGRWQDALFERTTQFFALFVLGLLAAILIALLISAWPALDRFGASFFFTNEWNPVTSVFGGLAPIYGTLVTSFIALAIGVPVSLAKPYSV